MQRFFALHVVVLPAIFLGLLGLHLWLVQKHGNAVPPSQEAIREEERASMPFFPNFRRCCLCGKVCCVGTLDPNDNPEPLSIRV